MFKKLISALSLFFIVSQGWAQTHTPEDLKRVEGALQETQQQKALLDSQVQAFHDEIAELKNKIDQAKQEISLFEQQVAEREQTLAALETDLASKTVLLEQNKKKLAQLVIYLHRLARTPPESYIARPQTPDRLIRTGMVLKQLLPTLSSYAKNFQEELTALKNVQTETQAEHEQLQGIYNQLAEKKDELAQFVAKRQQALLEAQKQQAKAELSLVQLSQEAKTIKDFIAALESKTNKKEKQKNTTISQTGTAGFPVQGEVLIGYGEKNQFGTLQQGITLQAPIGSPIVSPLSGTIVFAGPFRNYGKVLIIEHTGGYYSFISGFDDVPQKNGMAVQGGQKLGKVAATAKDYGEVYFEIRHHGRAVHPEKTLAQFKKKG